MRPSTSLILVVGAIISFGVAQAAPVIYEPFDYPVGELNAQSGVAESGFDSAWNANVTSLIVADSLTYGTLPTQGGSVGNLSNNVNRFGGNRGVSASALAGNGLLADGATVWFSVLVGYDLGGNVTNSRLAIALANSRFANANFNYNIADEGPQLGMGLGLTLGRFNNSNGRVTATQFRDGPTTNGVGFGGNVFGTTSDVLYAAGQHGLIVGKITWGAGATDTIELYQPDTDLNLGLAISTLTVDVDQSTFDTITWTRGDRVVLDEIRFGQSYEDVIGDTSSATPSVITEIQYSPTANSVTLTWASRPNASYIARYSLDLGDWDSDLGDDGLDAADDTNPDDGDHITVTFDLTDFALDGQPDVFFRIEEL